MATATKNAIITENYLYYFLRIIVIFSLQRHQRNGSWLNLIKRIMSVVFYTLAV